jgi:hypothetical protein
MASIASGKDTAFTCHRQAALALLNSGSDLTWRAGQFLGGLAFSDRPPSEKQAAWLGKLLERAHLPPLAMEEGQ